MPWPRPKPSSTARGLGHKHRQLREQLLPGAYGTLCPYWGFDPQCVGVMLRGQNLHLDHGIPRALGGHTADGTGRIAHGACNVRAGAALAHKLRKASPKPRRRSRCW